MNRKIISAFIFLFFFCFAFGKNWEKEVSLIENAINSRKYGDDFFSNFSEIFRKELPDEKFKIILDSIRSKYGKVISKEVKSESENFAIYDFEFSAEIITVKISRNSDGKINGLFFSNIRKKREVEKIFGDLNDLSFNKSFLIKNLKTGKILFSHMENSEMPIASAFKIYILAAVEKKDLDNILKTNRKYYSIPPSLINRWAEGYPVTVSTLLFLMIGESDNSATDHLINYFGEKRILNVMRKSGHSAYHLNVPLLSTSDVFKIRTSSFSAMYFEYNENMKRETLKIIRDEKLEDENLLKILDTPVSNSKIEWFASPSDMCNLFQYIYYNKNSRIMMDILKTGSMLPPEVIANYEYVGGKIGTDYGVLSVNWLLVTKKGIPYCFSFSGFSDKVLTYEELSTSFLKILSSPDIFE